MKKIKDKLDSDKEERKKCEKAIKRAKELYENSEDKSSASAGISLAIFPGVFAANCFLRLSWVLDGASAINLCNDTMAHRFKKDRDCTDGAYIIAGEGPIPIITYGSITVIVDSPNSTIPIKLSNVSYVPNFMTNLVSEGYLQKKGNLFKDPRANRVEYNGKTIIKYKIIGELYMLEDNTDSYRDVALSSFAAVKSGTTRDWHQLLAHAADNTIQHLQQAAEGVEITDKTKVPLTNDCSTCTVSKAYQVISTSLRKSEDSDEPFYRVIYNLIPISAGLNRYRWVSHLACAKTDFHIVDTHRLKSEAIKFLRRVFKLVQVRYKGKIVFIRSDAEPTLGKEFTDLMSELGISWEPSAPDTQAQNSYSERLGYILIIKARAMIDGGKLPHYLWP